MKLTHINQQGRSKMVDIGTKPETFREAKAKSVVQMNKHTLQLIEAGHIKKGDVLSVAQVAGIMAAKKTSDLIPMCHIIMIDSCDITFEIDHESSVIHIQSSVTCHGKTGVEMEALVAVVVAATTVIDMCKSVDKEMKILESYVTYKSGGTSGTLRRL